MARKQLWVLAGGNGAGKSTFYRLYLKPRGLRFVNADLIAKQLDRERPEQVSYQAAAIAAKLRTLLINSDASFCFETVFSHPSKIDFVADAKAQGYEVILVFVHLDNSELNQARVSQRVTEGGHDVPADKIIHRIPRTLKHIAETLPLVDRACLYDNSRADQPFMKVAEIISGDLVTDQESLPSWAQNLLYGFRKRPATVHALRRKKP